MTTPEGPAAMRLTDADIAELRRLDQGGHETALEWRAAALAAHPFLLDEVVALRARLVEVELELAEEARLRVKDCEDRNQQKRRGDLNWALVEDEKKTRQAAESRALAAEAERDEARRALDEMRDRHSECLPPGSKAWNEEMDRVLARVEGRKAHEATKDKLHAAEARLSEVEGALRETRPMVEAHRRKLLVEVQQHEKAADAEDIGDLPEVLTRASAIAQASDVLRAIDAALSGSPSVSGPKP